MGALREGRGRFLEAEPAAECKAHITGVQKDKASLEHPERHTPPHTSHHVQMQECREGAYVAGPEHPDRQRVPQSATLHTRPSEPWWPLGQRHPHVKADTAHNYASTWVSHAKTT